MSIEQSIARLRVRFECEQSAHPELYHPIDLERVRTEDWQVRRFVIDQPDGDEERAFVSLCKTLKWKKSFGIHDRTDQYFPKEFWVLNDIEVYGKSRAGEPVLWGAIRNKRAFKETALLAKQFVAHVLEQTDRIAGETGFIVVSDTNGSGFLNMDMDLSKFNTAILEYYPRGMRAMYVVDLPWLLNAIMKIMMGFMEPHMRHLVHFVKGSDLVPVIEPRYIPTALKGERDKHNFPPDLLPLDQLYRQYGTMDDKFVQHFYDIYKLPRTDCIKL